MMKKLSSFLFIFLFINILGFSSEINNSNKLIEDFDYLYQQIVENAISLDLYCQDLDVNYDSIYNKLRNELVTDVTLEHFFEQCLKLFNLSGDEHNSFVSSVYLKSLFDYLPEDERNATLNFVDTNFYAKTDSMYGEYVAFYKKYEDVFNIKTTYCSGKYYLTFNIVIGDTLISKGSEIVSINSLKTVDFIDQNQECYLFLYDIHTKSHYVPNLFRTRAGLPTIRSITFFEGKKNELVKCSISQSVEIEKETRVFLTMNLNRVMYHRSSKTLYLRLVRMIESEKFVKKIVKYKKKNFERIVIDVRNNLGGTDMAWVNVLSELIDSSFYKCRPQVCIKNSKYLNQATENTVKEQLIGYDDVRILDNDILDHIKSSNAPCLNTPIYCFMDKESFSSSLAFASLNMYLNNFNLVVNNVPYLGGMGFTPLTFMLPNTKILFRLNCSFDKKLYVAERNGLQADKVIIFDYMDEIEMENRVIRNYSSKRYCLHKNKFLDAVLEVDE